jgi:hypothetical protein
MKLNLMCEDEGNMLLRNVVICRKTTRCRNTATRNLILGNLFRSRNWRVLVANFLSLSVKWNP